MPESDYAFKLTPPQASAEMYLRAKGITPVEYEF
jgi:hypothetical protein